eukprot:12892398-Ditylum_brightwellii.AAC.1
MDSKNPSVKVLRRKIDFNLEKTEDPHVTPTIHQERKESIDKIVRSQSTRDPEGGCSDVEDIVVFDTKGGINSTVTKRVWH